MGLTFPPSCLFLCFIFKAKWGKKKKEKENEESVELCWCSFPQLKKKNASFFAGKKKKMPDETLRPRRADVSM